MVKKVFLCLIALIAAFALCACAANKTNNDSDPSTVTDTTKETDVSIPTDSGLADSVFDDSTTPTKAANGETTEPKETETATDATAPEDSTETTESSTGATTPDSSTEELTYEAFTALSPADQRLYQESFEDLDAFFAWYNAAKEKYEKENPPIDIDGPIDLGKY